MRVCGIVLGGGFSLSYWSRGLSSGMSSGFSGSLDIHLRSVIAVERRVDICRAIDGREL